MYCKCIQCFQLVLIKPLVKTGQNMWGNLHSHNNLVTSEGIYTSYVLLKQCERACFKVFQVGVLADMQTRSWIKIGGITIWANINALPITMLDACTCMQSLPNYLESIQNRYRTEVPTYVSHKFYYLFICQEINKSGFNKMQITNKLN